MSNGLNLWGVIGLCGIIMEDKFRMRGKQPGQPLKKQLKQKKIKPSKAQPQPLDA